MWIWQQADWLSLQQEVSPAFRYDLAVLSPTLRELHFLQGLLLGKMGGRITSKLLLIPCWRMSSRPVLSKAIS